MQNAMQWKQSHEGRKMSKLYHSMVFRGFSREPGKHLPVTREGALNRLMRFSVRGMYAGGSGMGKTPSGLTSVLLSVARESSGPEKQGEKE